jgi:LysR family transcriptional regulator (chromosome initiation inhibitor)
MSVFQFEQLQTLLALVEEGTFDAAAVRLGVTASAVSQRIKTLEQASGRVLVRRSNPAVATEAGEIVLRLARQVAVLDADTSAELQLDDRSNGSLSLAVAVNADSLATWFLEAAAQLPTSHGVVFDIHREDEEHTTALLRSGAVMAAVTSTAQPVQGCSVAPLGVMRYRCVSSPGFAQSNFGGRPSARELRGMLARAPMVNFDRKDELQLGFLRSLAQKTSQPEPPPARHYIPTSSDFARAVVLGYGWALVPEQQCLAELDRGALIDLAPGRHADVHLYWQRWKLSSALLDAVSEAVLLGARRSLHPM